MALLTENERKAIFKALGLGEYNKENIKAFQKKYLLRKSDYDGIYGQNTDNALRTVYYTKIYTKNFDAKEFRCECGGRYCSGYPDYMKPAELIHIQKIRDHYGKPITITCGLRDKKYNASLGGSVQNSLHLKGQALDFYQEGVTNTLANRKSAIKWIKKQANHHYTYGNGINSNGYYVNAPYMGNALHTDTYDNVKPTHPTLKTESSGTTTQETDKKPSTSVQTPSVTTPVTVPATTKKKLTVSGVGNKTTIKAMQKFFGTIQDGVISGQVESQSKYYPSIKSVSYGKGGSACIKKLQKWLGVSQDGILGKGTTKAWQKKLGVTADGIFGANSMKAWQKYLNEHDTPTYPKTTTTTKTNVSASKRSRISTVAKSYCGSKTKPTTAYKSAAKSVYGNGNNTNCHRFVGTVLAKCGYPKLPIGGKTATAWKNILAYFNKYATLVKTAKEDDIVIWWKGGIHYHIFAVVGGGKKAEAAHNKSYPHLAKYNPSAKYKKVWIYRMK